MGKQRCLNCDVIKDTQYFTLDRKYCDSCVSNKREFCKNCGSSFVPSDANKNKVCQKCLNGIESTRTKIIKKTEVSPIKPSSIKERLIHEIIDLVVELEVEEIPGFEDLDFTDISITQLQKLGKDELSLILDNLYEMYDDYIADEIKEVKIQPDLINPIDIVQKYKKLLDKKAEKNKPVEKWRSNIPKYIKMKVKNWKTESIQTIYEQSKVLMASYSGQNREEIMDFVCDLSELIFEETEKEKIAFNDIGHVEEWVLSHLEMIILPQLEVLDRLENNHGQLIFDESWTNDLTNTLIKEVHERDGWHCFICHDKNNLKIHQIISFNFKEVYHKHNLVTLCKSCGDAVNTRSVKKAIRQCLGNFIENY